MPRDGKIAITSKFTSTPVLADSNLLKSTKSNSNLLQSTKSNSNLLQFTKNDSNLLQSTKK